MRRTTLLIFAACILGLGFWYAFSIGDTPPPPLTADRDAIDVSRETSTRQVDSGTQVGEDATAQATNANAMRDELTSTSTLDRRNLLEVTVVDDTTQVPISGAKVVYEDVMINFKKLTGKDLAFFEGHGKDRKSDAVLERFGLRAESDAEGHVLIPIKAQAIYLRGTHGNLYGRLLLDPRRTPSQGIWEIQLSRDVSFDILVRNLQGKPVAGIPVGIRVDYDLQRSSRGPNSKRKTTKQTASQSLGRSKAPDGRVEIRHAQIFMRQFSRLSRIEADFVACRAILKVPGLSNKGVEIDWQEPPRGPVILTLPAVGSIKLVCRDKHGNRITEQAWVRLKPLGIDFFGRKPVYNTWTKRAENSEVVFDHVALGESYSVTAFLRNVSAKKTIIGPTTPNQQVDEILTFENKGSVLKGRVLDANHAPLANTDLVIIFAIGERDDSIQCSSDANGQFRAIMSPSVSGKTATSIELVKRRSRWQKSSSSSGKRPTDFVMTNGVIDIGDFVLEPAPLLVSGRLITDSTANLAKVTLTPQYLSRNPSPELGKPRWREAQQLDIEREENGAFAFYAQADSHSWRIRVRSSQHTKIEPIEFTPGEQDLEIPLNRGSALNVVVHTEKFVKQDSLRLLLMPRGRIDSDPFVAFGETGTGRARTLGSEPGRLRYNWASVEAGTYDLVARLFGESTPMAVRRGITLPYTGDPIEIDLRGKFHHIVLEVTDESGKPLSLAAVTVLTGFDGKDMEGFRIRQGKATIVTARDSVDLMILGRGYQPEVILGVSGDTRVALRRRGKYQVLLQFKNLGKLPKGARLRATLQRQRIATKVPDTRYFSYNRYRRQSVSSWTQWGDTQNKDFKTSPAKAILTSPGTYRLEVHLRSKKGKWRRLTDVKPTEFTVLDQSSEQTFQFEIPDSSWNPSDSK